MKRQQQIDLFNLFYGFNSVVEDYDDLSDEEFEEQAWFPFLEDIVDKGYDGEEEYYPIYWFIKGMKANTEAPKIDENKPINPSEVKLKPTTTKKSIIPKPPSFIPHILLKPLPPKLSPQEVKIKRYDESDEYIKNHTKSVIEKVMENQKLKKISNEYQPKINREEFMKPYDEYKRELENQNEKINKLAVELGKKLNALDNNWEINFEDFDNNGRKQLFPILNKWLHTKIDVLPLTDHYKFSFKVGDKWHTRPFNQDVYEKLKSTFTEGSLLYEMDSYNPDNEFISGGPEDFIPNWSLFSAIRIEKIEKLAGVRDDIGGHFFKYLIIPSAPESIKNHLNRYQILDSIVEKEETAYFEEKEIKTGKYSYNPYSGEQEEDIDYIPEKTIYKYSVREELDDCCFIYALKISGKFTEDELNLMRLRITSRYLSVGKIDKLCKEFKIKVIVIERDDEKQSHYKRRTVQKGKNKFLGYADASEDRTVILGLIENHYFIYDERTPFTSSYIQHMETAPIDAYNKTYRKVRGVYKWINDKEPKRFLDSIDLIRELMKKNKFIPINYATGAILKTTLYENVKDVDFPLEPTEECFKLIVDKSTEDKKDEKEEPTYWYSDFESDTRHDLLDDEKADHTHVPFLNVLHSADGKIDKVFTGKNCAIDFLNFLPDNSICYFHNLAYDWCMFNQHVSKVLRCIKKGGKVYKALVLVGEKKITFKDSLPIFQCKLSRLPVSFGLTGIKKELFPYNYYTLERLENNIGIINEAGAYEAKKWSEKEYDLFIENIDSIPGCRLSDKTFDMYKYAIFYCEQDVRILRLSFEKITDGFMKEFNIDVRKVLTTPSLANQFFTKSVYIPNGNMYSIGGHVREFVARAIKGGRCMTAFNKKWHTNKPILDYDAVSLYPSAMNRLWCVEGKPEVLKVEEPEKIYNSIPDYLEKYNTITGTGAYVIEIEILKVNKHYAFPLIVQKTKNGNLNDDNITEPIKITVDNIYLEDLIEFQKIEFRVIRGYIWNGKRDYRIQQTIKSVFNKRLEFKKQKNPLQELYKLIMNSSYGKTIEKPIKEEIKFLSKWKRTYKDGTERPSELESYWIKNYDKIIEEIDINEDESIVKVRKQIDDHFNFSLFGVQVLSMSKRIMNEVMCLGYDLGCHIYYQDTDSIHIEADDLPKLESAFEEKYNRILRGTQLGQFHSDFPTINGHDEIPKSIESYFIMKKCYIDNLQDSTGEIDYMIRGKGLTTNSILHAGKLKNGLMNLYKSLYEGNTEEFDLTSDQPMFQMNSNFTVETKKDFIRRTKTEYEEGNRNDYFTYGA